MKSILIFVLLILTLNIEIDSSLLRMNKNAVTRTKLDEEKEQIQQDINSMLLGNYLRKLMLKVI